MGERSTQSGVPRPVGKNVIGGMGMTTSVEVFNFDTNMWSDGPSLPEARASLGCAVSITAAEHVVVCAGGYVHAFKSDVWKLDLTDSSASWVSLPNMLATSEDPLVLASNGYIYAIWWVSKPWQYVKHSSGDGHVELVAQLDVHPRIARGPKRSTRRRFHRRQPKFYTYLRVPMGQGTWSISYYIPKWRTEGPPVQYSSG